ncbi:DUF1330 domain-containing protein [Dankookia sp. GCM10030260]|uniref:DUF1330 domain-containing protein n=1 Tax=Dankookia sp. GCM10030260 TaxID=3273390 RepID=UPI00360ED88B
MPAYLIANIRVKDPAKFAAYRDQVAPMIARFGGRYLIRGGAVTPVEGAPALERVVVLEFPTMAGLKAFYHSPDYTPLIALRQEASDGDVALVEGYEPG